MKKLTANPGFARSTAGLLSAVAFILLAHEARARILETETAYSSAKGSTFGPDFGRAGELKFSTTQNSLIGPGRTDFAGYLIGSRRFGRLDAHANLGYTKWRNRPARNLKSIFNFALGGEYQLTPRTSFYGKLLALRQVAGQHRRLVAARVGSGAEATTLEAPTGEAVGTMGVASFVTPSGGPSLDNRAVLLRKGFTVKSF